ncbi:MAG: hypothetical protein KAS63_04810 [Candidatus Heimdallarchaeota archaeon]|nr:hypothetical protein [Candidatus Heimdallarchaeota archaeon]MCK4954656.1 hypothetical protein [Candidatus Heimdallarchaeota archaeon]
MGEKEHKIHSYIAGMVTRFLPKNEEIIHSGLFLALSKEENLRIPDWYFNGYSVISETVSSHLQILCKSRFLTFTNEGLYSVAQNQSEISTEELEQAKSDLEQILLDCTSGLQVVKKAKKRFHLNNVGAIS